MEKSPQPGHEEYDFCSSTHSMSPDHKIHTVLMGSNSSVKKENARKKKNKSNRKRRKAIEIVEDVDEEEFTFSQ